MGQESRHSLVVSCASGSLTRLQSVGSQLGLRWLLAGFSSSRGCQMEASASVTHSVTYWLEASHRHHPHARGEDYTRHWLGATLDSSSGLHDCCSSHMQNAPASQVLQGSHPIIASIWAPESQHLHQSQVWLRCLGCSSWSPAPGTQFFSVCELARLMTQVISPHTRHKKVGLQSMAARATPSQNRRKCGGKGVQWSHCPSSNAHVWVCSKCPELNSNVILFCAFALSWSFLYKYVVSFLLLLF